jgi:hypothetical protein
MEEIIDLKIEICNRINDILEHFTVEITEIK